jgi:hypothetical protein
MRGARFIVGCAAVATLVVLAVPGAVVAAARAPTVVAAAAGSISVAPAADTYVSAARRTQNFGNAKTLLAGPGKRARAFMRFDLRGLDARVVKAKLRFYALQGSRGGILVTTATDPFWIEGSPTYVKHPKAVRRAALLPRLRRGWNTIDLTKVARSKYLISLVLSSTRGRAVIASREAGAHGPRLVANTVPVAAGSMVAAGDIASCTSTGDEATAALVDTIPGTVAALGDLAYENGSTSDFSLCYSPTWGRFKPRTRPAPGNHEYQTPHAAPYYAYFGAAAGDPTKGYYSYNLGAWHVIVLNSNCGQISGGCGRGSPQVAWLKRDLAAHRNFCTLAYWHHPRFSSGRVGSDAGMETFWDTLYAARADLVLVGHDHDYERFAPQGPNGVAAPNLGLREIVVGTGGASHFVLGTPIANSEVGNDTTFGVLHLTLRAARYDWQFLPVAGASFTDAGSTACH